MALSHPDPFREIERFLDGAWQEAWEQEDQEIEVAADVYRRGQLYLIAMDLPGVAPHRIDVVIEGRALSVRARRFAGPVSASATSLLYERPRGTYDRTIGFKENLDGRQGACDLRLGRAPPLGPERPDRRHPTLPGPDGWRRFLDQPLLDWRTIRTHDD